MNIARYSRPVFNNGEAAGGGAAPSASIDTAVSGQTSTPGDSSSGDSFDGLGGFEDDSIEINFDGGAELPSQDSTVAALTPAATSVPPSPASAEGATQAAAPATPAQPVVPAAAAASVPPAATPAPQQTAPDAQASPATNASVASDPDGLLAQLGEHREGVLDALANSGRFALSQDEATALETDPAKAFPRLAAKIFYEANNAMLSHISSFVPAMVSRHLQAVKLQTEAETAFYGQFPGLSKDKHAADVMSFAKVFKAQNPQISRADLFASIGAAVMAKHGILPGATPQPNGSGAPAPASVQVQPSVTPPFVPAAGGASVRMTPIEDSPFAGLAQDWDN